VERWWNGNLPALTLSESRPASWSALAFPWPEVWAENERADALEAAQLAIDGSASPCAGDER
jgi:hypothetical protein